MNLPELVRAFVHGLSGNQRVILTSLMTISGGVEQVSGMTGLRGEDADDRSTVTNGVDELARRLHIRCDGGFWFLIKVCLEREQLVRLVGDVYFPATIESFEPMVILDGFAPEIGLESSFGASVAPKLKRVPSAPERRFVVISPVSIGTDNALREYLPKAFQSIGTDIVSIGEMLRAGTRPDIFNSESVVTLYVGGTRNRICLVLFSSVTDSWRAVYGLDPDRGSLSRSGNLLVLVPLSVRQV